MRAQTRVVHGQVLFCTLRLRAQARTAYLTGTVKSSSKEEDSTKTPFIPIKLRYYSSSLIIFFNFYKQNMRTCAAF